MLPKNCQKWQPFWHKNRIEKVQNPFSFHEKFPNGVDIADIWDASYKLHDLPSIRNIYLRSEIS